MVDQIKDIRRTDIADNAATLGSASHSIPNSVAPTEKGAPAPFINPEQPTSDFSIVKAEGLVRRYGDFIAVNGIDFQVQAGEVFGLLGPNGAGKSTTIKMLVTLLPPSGGRASVGGYDIATQAGSVRRLIGYVPQALSADGSLTGLENLTVMA